MSGIVGQGTTYNLPNFHGELFTVSPTDTKFLSMIGGLTGGRPARATEFEWQTYDLRAPDATRTRLEGANAPNPENRVRANVSNIVQIFQETVEVSYTKLAAVAAMSGINVAESDLAVSDEFTWQLVQTLKQIARDVNVALLKGTYHKPTDNTTARATRGLLNAITTNVSANGGVARDLTRTVLLDLLQTVWANGGIQEEETASLFVNGALKRALTKIFLVDANYREQSRNVGGLDVDTIETDFGTLNVVLDRWMPADQVAVLSLDVCAPRILEIPGKGFLFAEPLAKNGAAERSQVYGEIGLEYGHEAMHGLIKDVQAPAGA